MPGKKSTTTPSVAGGALGESAAARGEVSSNGRFLTITDPKNKMIGGKLTISVEVEGSSLKGLSARDDVGNVYEVSFRVIKPGRKKVSKSQPPESVAAPTSSDDDEGNDECQCCSIVNGRLACHPCPCGA